MNKQDSDRKEEKEEHSSLQEQNKQKWKSFNAYNVLHYGIERRLQEFES